jgi:DNA-directed RNA polymerase specialized sigma24 family protein
MSKRLEAALLALHHKETTFTRFARDTREDWDRLSGKMFGRWQLPAGVSDEDVRQEMLIGAWQGVARWDPSRGTPLATFVCWTACNKAAKWIHGQRKARHGKAPSRHPLTMGALGVNADGELSESEVFDLFSSVEPEQEARVDHDKVAAQLEGLSTTALHRDAVRVWMLVGGDVVEAGVDLWFDPVARADHGLRSPRQSVRAVEQAVREVEQGLGRLAREATP